MVVDLNASTNTFRTSVTAFVAWWRSNLGFSPAATPLVIAAGLAFLMISLPQLFAELGGTFSFEQPQLRWVIDHLAEWSQSWDESLRRAVGPPYSNYLVQGSFFVMPALVVASAIRAIRAGTRQPIALTVGGLAAGVLAIPAIAWIIEVIIVIVRVARSAAAWVSDAVAWLSGPATVALAATAALAVVAAIGYGLFIVASEHWWPRVLVVGVVASLVAGFAYLGGAALLARFASSVAAAISTWSEKYVSPIIEWVVVASFIGIVALAVTCATVAVLGETGRTIYFSLTSATDAGAMAGRCADLAAGTGVAMSLMLTASVCDPEFRFIFTANWQDVSILGKTPFPVFWFDTLLPDLAEDYLAPAFVGYSPIIDSILLTTVGTLGALSLLLSTRRWKGGDARLTRPVFLATVVAVATAIPLVLMALAVNHLADGSE